jgi:hypothetical protein
MHTPVAHTTSPGVTSASSGIEPPATAMPSATTQPTHVGTDASPSPLHDLDSTSPEPISPRHPEPHGSGAEDATNPVKDGSGHTGPQSGPTHEDPRHTHSSSEPHSGDDLDHQEHTPDDTPDSIPPHEIPPPLVRDSPYETGGLNPDYLGEQFPGGPMGPPGVTYLDDAGREEHRITIRDGVIYDAKGLPFDTSNGVSAFGPSSNGRAIFVMDEHGNLYASTFQKISRVSPLKLARRR